jgi:protease-4
MSRVQTLSLALIAALALPQAASAQFGTKKPEPPVVAVFPFDGPITEKPMPEDPLFGSLKSESLQSLTARMEKAAKDDNVKAVVVLLGGSSFGYGQLEEIRTALQKIRDAGKPIYAHADSLSTTGSYALLSSATRLSVSPTGDLWVTGLYGEGVFLRGLLDKLGVQPDFLTCGDYKSAGEMFTRTAPSPESDKMQNWLFDSIYETLIDLIAKGRKVERELVQDWIDTGLYSAETAKKAGLIDAVEYRAEFVAAIKETTGANVKFDKSYGKPKGLTLDMNNPFAVLQLYMQILAGPQQRRSTKDAIAIVYVEGPIMPGNPEQSLLGVVEGAYSEPIRKALEKVAADDLVKGVVLRVDSPGGSAVASEIILDATKRVKAKKPIVVSMGNVAGSGGYYVACGVDRIIADRATLTGSIGVVAGKLATTGLWDKAGIHFHPYQRGKKASMMSSGTIFSPEEKQELQNWMDEVYEVFKGHVVESRGKRLKKPIDELAGGRVYTGGQALELGLVDEIGTLDDAVKAVAKQAGVEDYEIRTVPRAKGLLEGVFAELSPSSDEDSGTLSLGAPQPGISRTLLDAALPLLEGLDPRRVQMIRQALGQLDIIQQERVMLTMPVLDIRD